MNVFRDKNFVMEIPAGVKDTEVIEIENFSNFRRRAIGFIFIDDILDYLRQYTIVPEGVLDNEIRFKYGYRKRPVVLEWFPNKKLFVFNGAERLMK